jgi:hypothetical protein
VPACKNPTLHVTTPGSIYCGFDVDGGSFYCPSSQECCLGGSLGTAEFAPDECSAFGSVCTNPVGTSIPIECSQISDCTANGVSGAVCCLQGVSAAPSIVAGCSYYKEYGGSAVTCESPDGGAIDAGGGTPSCATGEVQICQQDADCPIGKTCIPMAWKVFDIGFCQ